MGSRVPEAWRMAAGSQNRKCFPDVALYFLFFFDWNHFLTNNGK
jgi:hypothetical protein